MKQPRAAGLVRSILVFAAVVAMGWLGVCAAGPSDLPGAEQESAPDTTELHALPGEEISVPESQVADRFYSYLIGLVSANICGVVDGERLSAILGSHRGKTAIPFTLIDEIRRDCTPHKGARRVSIMFKDDLKTPVPYDILGYHPGSVVASKSVNFLEWYLPSQKVTSASGEPINLTQVFIFAVYDGWAVVDIDAWVDKLLGGYLDDTRIAFLALFRYKDEWNALAGGYGPSGEGRSGIFNFQTNKILFPTPPELQGVAPYFRNLVVRNKHVTAPMPPSSRWKSAKQYAAGR